MTFITTVSLLRYSHIPLNTTLIPVQLQLTPKRRVYRFCSICPLCILDFHISLCENSRRVMSKLFPRQKSWKAGIGNRDIPTIILRFGVFSASITIRIFSRIKRVSERGLHKMLIQANFKSSNLSFRASS